MGEVYQARDTRLGRDVALTVLPEALTSNPDRQARRIYRSSSPLRRSSGLRAGLRSSFTTYV